MRKLLYASAMAVIASSIVSCGQKADNGRAEAAGSLYHSSVALTLAYTDSLGRAKDSATVIRLVKEFDDTLTHLNFRFPADTDIDMSEGQNDTLSRLNSRFVHLRDSLLYSFAHPARPDSIATDSIMQPDGIPAGK